MEIGIHTVVEVIVSKKALKSKYNVKKKFLPEEGVKYSVVGEDYIPDESGMKVQHLYLGNLEAPEDGKIAFVANVFVKVGPDRSLFPKIMNKISNLEGDGDQFK